MFTGRMIEAKPSSSVWAETPRTQGVWLPGLWSQDHFVSASINRLGATLPLSLHLVLSNSKLWAPSQAAGLCLIARHSPDWSQVGIIHYPRPVLAAVCSIHCTLGRSPHSRQRFASQANIFPTVQCSSRDHMGLGRRKKRSEVQWMLISRIIPSLWTRWWEEEVTQLHVQPFPGPPVQWSPLTKQTCYMGRRQLGVNFRTKLWPLSGQSEWSLDISPLT